MIIQFMLAGLVIAYEESKHGGKWAIKPFVALAFLALITSWLGDYNERDGSIAAWIVLVGTLLKSGNGLISTINNQIG